MAREGCGKFKSFIVFTHKILPKDRPNLLTLILKYVRLMILSFKVMFEVNNKLG